jgi:phage portal protein BeeE
MFGWFTSAVGRLFSRDAVPAGTKAARGATLTSAIGIGVTGGAAPMWTEHEARRRFCEWVFAAVNATARRIAAQPVRVGRKVKASTPSGSKAAANPAASGARVKELPEHPLCDLLDTPNPFLSESQLIGLIVAALETSGVAYVWFDEQPGDQPPRLWFLPCAWLREDPDADVPLSKWIVRPENSADEFRLNASELIRIATPDPANPFRPFSPLMACLKSAVADEEILLSQLATFQNGGKPGLLVRIGQEAASSPLGDKDEAPALTEHQRRVLRQRIKEATSGSLNAGEPVILDAVIKEVTKLTNSPQEMDFGNSSLLVRDRILGIYGVPEVVLGLNDNANRASATVADEVFCAKLAGICRLISDAFTSFFRIRFEDPALCVWLEAPRPRDPDGRRADLQQLIGAGALTVDELRAEHGLPPLPDGKGAAIVRAAAAATQTPPADPPDRDDRKAAPSPLERLNRMASGAVLKNVPLN